MLTGLLSTVIKHLANKELGRLPCVRPVYRFAWQHFGPKGVKVAEVDGMRLNVICRDWAVAPTMLFSHMWEPEETTLFKKHIKPGGVVVDAGAYIGYYTVLASKLVGEAGRVYAFEPSPENRDVLKSNVQMNDCANTCLVPKAVSDREGKVAFYPNHRNASGSTLFKDGHTTKDTRVEVNTVSLDLFFGNKKVDFIKMDIEGGETKALKGMVNVIKNNPNLKMIVEVFPDGLKNAGSSPDELVESLLRDFKLYIVGGDETRNVGIVEIRQEIEKSAVINLFCVRKANTK